MGGMSSFVLWLMMLLTMILAALSVMVAILNTLPITLCLVANCVIMICVNNVFRTKLWLRQIRGCHQSKYETLLKLKSENMYIIPASCTRNRKLDRCVVA